MCPNCREAVEGPGPCGACEAPLLVGGCRLVEERRRGPDGDVFGGLDARAGKAVAVHLLPESTAVGAELAAARRAGGLIHPHLAAVLDAGAYRGRAYVVFEDAGDARATDASLSLREIVALVRDAATGVEYAAGRGRIHPGLHPDCLRLTRKGRVYVTGYERAEGGGSVAFRAPEVRAGKAVDAPANVYSLGAVLYALAVGREPDAQAVEPPGQANPLVPGEIEDLILRAMDADPHRRPAAGAFVAYLSRWLDGPAGAAPAPATAPAAAGPAPAWRRVWEDVPPAGRLPLLAGACLLGLLGLAGLIAAAVRGGDEAEIEPPLAAKAPGEIAANPVAEPVPPPAPPEPPVVKEEPPPPPPAPVVVKPEPPPLEPVVVSKPPPPEPVVAPKPPPPPPVVEPAPAPPPPPPLPPAADRVGTVKFVHAEYGVFVRLDAKGTVAVGDALEVLKDGAVVARLKVRTISRPETVYPNGAAVCDATGSGAAEGQSVRRAKP